MDSDDLDQVKFMCGNLIGLLDGFAMREGPEFRAILKSVISDTFGYIVDGYSEGVDCAMAVQWADKHDEAVVKTKSELQCARCDRKGHRASACTYYFKIENGTQKNLIPQQFLAPKLPKGQQQAQAALAQNWQQPGMYPPAPYQQGFAPQGYVLPQSGYLPQPYAPHQPGYQPGYVPPHQGYAPHQPLQPDVNQAGQPFVAPPPRPHGGQQNRRP